ncbi:MAG: hypothetical protein ABI690_14220 [Chloroflexota bacterium]
MPISNSWDNDEKTIIRMDVSGIWTWDDLNRAFDESSAMLDSVNHTVYPIVDLSQSQNIPANFIPNARSLMKKRHPRSGMAVFVGASALVISLWRMFARIYTIIAREQDFAFADTVDEARSILNQHVQSTTASEKVTN